MKVVQKSIFWCLMYSYTDKLHSRCIVCSHKQGGSEYLWDVLVV